MQCLQGGQQRNCHASTKHAKRAASRCARPAAALPTAGRQAAIAYKPQADGESEYLYKFMKALDQDCERLEHLQSEFFAEAESTLDAFQYTQRLVSFMECCSAVIDIAAALPQLYESSEAYQSSTRLGVRARFLEQQTAMDVAVFRLIQSSLKCCQPASSQDLEGDHLEAAALLERLWALEGYHPDDPAAYSVVLSRGEKVDLLQGLRSQELALLSDLMGLCGQGPEVEVTADELQDDPLLGAVACWQQQQLHQQWRDTGSGQHPHGAPDGAQPAATQQQQEEEEEEVVVTLDGIACSHLLAAHPDPGLRRQVYQEAVEPGGLAVLRVLDDLAAVRAKIARLYGAPSYAALTSRLTLLGSADQAAGFLLHLAHLLRPACEAQAQLAQAPSEDTSGMDPWEVDHHLWATAVSSQRQHQATGPSQQEEQTWHQTGGGPPPAIPPVPDLLRAVSQELLGPGWGVTLSPASAHQLRSMCSACAGSSEEQDTLVTLLAACLAEQQGQCLHGQGELQGPAPESAAGLHVYAVQADDGGHVGTLVVNLRPHQSWSGTRYLLPCTCVDQQECSSTGAGPPDGSSSAGAASTRVGPVVLMCLQPPTPAAPTGTPSEVLLPSLLQLREALHELGHALHLLLSWRPSPLPTPVPTTRLGRKHHEQDKLQGLLGCSRACIPGSLASSPLLLPLELLELPSTLMELLTCSPTALRRILTAAAAAQVSGGAAQRPGSRSWADPAVAASAAEQLAAASRAAWFSPLGLQLQVVACLTDQLLLLNKPTRNKVTPGADNAQEVWALLCQQLLPGSVPPMFAPLQLLTLPRLGELRGQGYGYLAALALAAGAWHAHGLTTEDPWNPAAWRHLRRKVYEQGPGGLVTDAAALHEWLGQVVGHQVATVIPGALTGQGEDQSNPGVVLRAPGALLNLVLPKM